MIATGLKDYLEAESVGTFGTDLFISKMPDTPNDVLCIYDQTAPVLPEMSSYDANNFGTKILVRGSYSFCKTTILALLRKIPMLAGVYDSIQIIDSRIEGFTEFIEVDDKGRRLYSLNFSHYCNIGNNKNRTGNYTP